MSETTARLKILLLGDNRVGKTSLIRRYVHGTFSEGYQATLGVDFVIKKVKLPLNKRAISIQLQIWDIAGHAYYASYKKAFFQNTKGVMLVYDVTRKQTFENTNRWVDDVYQHSPGVPIILVGNKSDLRKQKVVKISESKKMCQTWENCIGVIETSAKTGDKVNTAFEDLTYEILVRHLNKK